MLLLNAISARNKRSAAQLEAGREVEEEEREESGGWIIHNYHSGKMLLFLWEDATRLRTGETSVSSPPPASGLFQGQLMERRDLEIQITQRRSYFFPAVKKAL